VTAGRATLLWLAVLAGPVAWAAQLVTGYGIEEYGCSAGGGSGTVAGVRTDRLELLVTVAALALVAVGALAALRTWRASDDAPSGHVAFLGWTALLATFVFAVTIVLAGVGVLVLSPCEAG
jgi:hypothetical protein